MLNANPHLQSIQVSRKNPGQLELGRSSPGANRSAETHRALHQWNKTKCKKIAFDPGELPLRPSLNNSWNLSQREFAGSLSHCAAQPLAASSNPISSGIVSLALSHFHSICFLNFFFFFFFGGIRERRGDGRGGWIDCVIKEPKLWEAEQSSCQRWDCTVHPRPGLIWTGVTWRRP